MEDSYRHKGMRRKLIQRLQERGIKNEAVLEVMLNLPRHFFLEKAFEEWAYEDKAFPIGKEQTISQPYTVAYQTTLLQVAKGDKILEIGTGSAYQAAVLALLGAKVFSIERQSFLFEKATQLIKKLNIPNIFITLSDGMLGLKQEAPFDKILVTCGADELPLALVEQLKIGGQLVIPIGDEKTQQMYRITKLSPTEWQEERFDDFRFVPLLSGVV
jgi:protein-L-isoaspartate(D-aspartate) O-methyltransferase